MLVWSLVCQKQGLQRGHSFHTWGARSTNSAAGAPLHMPSGRGSYSLCTEVLFQAIIHCIPHCHRTAQHFSSTQRDPVDSVSWASRQHSMFECHCSTFWLKSWHVGKLSLVSVTPGPKWWTDQQRHRTLLLAWLKKKDICSHPTPRATKHNESKKLKPLTNTCFESKWFVSCTLVFSFRFHEFHAQPSVWHLQPFAPRGESRHGAAPVQLLHRLVSQHVPDRRPAPLPLQDRHVRLGAAVRLPLCRRSANAWIKIKNDVPIWLAISQQRKSTGVDN